MKKKINYIILLGLMPFFSCSYTSSDYTDDLGEGYVFVSESSVHQIISGPNDTSWTGIIPCTVELYEYDDKHIIAKQKANPDCVHNDLSKVAFSYWIIDKKENRTYGPLDSVTFNNKRKVLSVSASLKFVEK